MAAHKNTEAGFVISTLQKCLNTWKSKKEGSFHVEYKEGRLSIKYSLGVPDANQTRHRRDGRRSVNRTSRDNNTPKAPRRNRTREIKRKKSANRILRDNARAAAHQAALRATAAAAAAGGKSQQEEEAGQGTTAAAAAAGGQVDVGDSSSPIPPPPILSQSLSHSIPSPPSPPPAKRPTRDRDEWQQHLDYSILDWEKAELFCTAPKAGAVADPYSPEDLRHQQQEEDEPYEDLVSPVLREDSADRTHNHGWIFCQSIFLFYTTYI